MATTKSRRRQEPPKQKLKPKVPLRLLSNHCDKLSSRAEMRRQCRKKRDSFVIHLRDKFSFMEILGLKFAYPVVKHLKVDNNNDENHVDNNRTLVIRNRKLILHGSKDKIRSRYIYCSPCNRKFKSRKSYDNHLRKLHPSLLQFSCKICSKRFLNRTYLQQHKDKHRGRKPYMCTKCTMKFECLDALTAHVRRHLGKLPYICKICKDGFELHIDYKQHLTVHEMKPSEKSNRKVFTCIDCDKEFRKPCDLERHTRVHTGERPFVCAVCGNRFQQAHNLTKHMIIHTQEKRFQCEICLKLFGRSDVLTRHMLTHAVNKPFSCSVCDKTFARALQLTQHTAKHH